MTAVAAAAVAAVVTAAVVAVVAAVDSADPVVRVGPAADLAAAVVVVPEVPVGLAVVVRTASRLSATVRVADVARNGRPASTTISRTRL